jgi:hypothetical protein
MPKAIALIGAGASFGAGGILPGPPPLGKGLFSELVSHCQVPISQGASVDFCWGTLDQSWRHAFVEDFEKAMHDLKGTVDPEQLATLLNCMASYFLQFGLDRTGGLYVKLFSSLLETYPGPDDFAVCSLNYESLADYAVNRCGRFSRWFRSPDHVSAPDEVRVFRPHGSVNFVANLNSAPGGWGFGGPVGGAAKIMTPFDTSGPDLRLEFKTNKDVIARLQSDAANGYAPPLALYMEDKPVLVSTKQISEIRAAYAHFVEDVDTVIIVGTRLTLADKHVFEPILNNQKCRVFFVGESHFLGQLDSGVAKFQEIMRSRFEIVGQFFSDLELGVSAPWRS